MVYAEESVRHARMEKAVECGRADESQQDVGPLNTLAMSSTALLEDFAGISSLDLVMESSMSGKPLICDGDELGKQPRSSSPLFHAA